MSILGIAEAVVAPLIRALAAAGADPTETGDADPAIDRAAIDRAGIADRFARAAWSCVAEPGDRTAALASRALGPASSLQRILDRVDPSRFAAELSERGAELDATEAEQAIARWSPRLSAEQVLRACRQAVRFDIGLVVPGDEEWPESLGELGDYAPQALWLRGRRALLPGASRSVAVVGARAATGYGEHVAIELSAGLVDRGYAIVSGAAYGIDAAAHRAALASSGLTVAFLAGGLDRVYPSGHEELVGRIAEHGLVLSEVPCGTAPTKWRFLQRNRLIAATALATVVVEAGWRSGSINTARLALELGRPVGVVPGPVTSSASAGCHRMLREWPAVCVTSAADVAELAPLPELEHAPMTADESEAAAGRDPDGARTRLLDALSGRSPRSAERIAALSGLALDRVSAELGLLELEGAVRRRPNGWMRWHAE